MINSTSAAANEWMHLLCALSPQLIHPMPPENAASENAAAMILAACRNAGIEAFLKSAADNREPLLLAVNDAHRFTDTASAIECIILEIDKSKLNLRLRLLVCTGSHQIENPAEALMHEKAMIGPHRERFEAIDWHNAFDPGRLMPLAGEDGVRMHHWMAESGHILAIGSMEPHYFAGITGAHKTLTIGAFAYEDITANHFNALSPDAEGLKMDGNPIYEGLAAVIRQMETAGKHLFAINEVMSGAKVSACYAGRPLESLHRAAPEIRRRYGRQLPLQDLIVSIVHPPLNRDLYQADKGIKNVEPAVRDGGTIILDAQCAGGVGISRFFQLLKRSPTHAQAVRFVEDDGYQLGDHKAVRLRALTDRRKVRLLAYAPGLEENEAEICGIQLFNSREQAAQWAMEQLALQAGHVTVVDDAGNLTLQKTEHST